MNGMPSPYYQDETVTIYHGDCREILPLLPCVDLVLTDPPYLEGDWSGVLPELIASGTRLVVTPGKLQSFRWIQCKTPAWEYAWLGHPTSLGGSACLHIGWEPILAYHMPIKPVGNDVLEYPITKQAGVGSHPWPKPLPLFKKLVSHWSLDGHTVLDPFTGSGTTLRAAKDLGRKAIGIEIDEEYCEIAAKRMAQTVMLV